MQHIFKNKKFYFPAYAWFVLSLLFSEAVLVAIAWLVLKLNIEFSMVKFYAVVALLGLALLVIFAARFFNRPDYVVTESEMIIRNNKRELHRFPYARCKISPYIEKRKRFVVVKEGRKEKKHEVNISGKKFDELVSLVEKYSAVDENPVEME
ncbi:MAG: hypothetical protein FWG53_03095 [Clostridiales bacterium]|nr:hypothetical protein [Clostridiales bacterium]